MGLAYLVIALGIPLAIVEMLFYDAWDSFMYTIYTVENWFKNIGSDLG